MSTSDHRAAYQPGEQLLREASERMAQWQQQQRDSVTSYVGRNLSEYEQRYGEDAQPMCELMGRLEETREFAPADIYEEVQVEAERGADLQQLAESVERLEREAAQRYENREICQLALDDIARRSGGAAENPVWQSGGRLKSTFHFRGGRQMAAEVSEKSLADGGREISWLGRTADTRDCQAQEDAVNQVVESLENMRRVGGPSPRPGQPPEERAEQEAAGGAS